MHEKPQVLKKYKDFSIKLSTILNNFLVKFSAGDVSIKKCSVAKSKLVKERWHLLCKLGRETIDPIAAHLEVVVRIASSLE